MEHDMRNTTTTVVIAAGLVLAGAAALLGGQEESVPMICCVTEQGCLFVDTANDCAALGGIVPQGGGWCNEPGCDIVQACCHDDGTCSIQSQVWCQGNWGKSTSDLSVPGDCGTACLVGACCGDASCIVMTLGECEASGNIFRGEGVSCADFNGNGIPDTCEPINNCRSDSNDDGIVGIIDLLTLLADWGPCS